MFEKNHEKKGGRIKGSKNKTYVDLDLKDCNKAKELLLELLFKSDQKIDNQITLLKALIPYLFLKPIHHLDLELKELEIETKRLINQLLIEKHAIDLSDTPLDLPFNPRTEDLPYFPPGMK